MHLTIAQAKALGITLPVDLKENKNKFGAIPTIYNGRRYASKKEAERAARLDMMLAAKLIREWWPQPRYALGNHVNIYVGDFLVVDRDGNHWTEDAKGKETPKFQRDRKLWGLYGRHPLIVLGKAIETVPGGLQTRPWPEWSDYQ